MIACDDSPGSESVSMLYDRNSLGSDATSAHQPRLRDSDTVPETISSFGVRTRFRSDLRSWEEEDVT